MKFLIEKFRLIGKIVRWSSWSDTKIVFFVTSVGLLILEKDTRNLMPYFHSIFWMTFLFFIVYGSCVSIVNDYWDRFIDIKAGKNRAASYINDSSIIFILIALLIVLMGMLYLLAKSNVQVTLLGSLMILLAILYSSPPLRFKEKPPFDLIVGSLIQRVLPVLLVFQIFHYDSLAGYVFATTLFILGARIMLMHQLEDLAGDLKSGVKTSLTLLGVNFGKKTIKILYIPEIITLFLFSSLVGSINVRSLVWVYLTFWITLYLFIPRVRRSFDLFSLNDSLLSDFYYIWLPLYVAVFVFIRTGDPVLILLALLLQKKHVFAFFERITGRFPDFR